MKLDNILDRLAEVCEQKNVLIATAESCTGGLVAKLITDRAGSSRWFERGFVTYSNLSKEEMLGVSSESLKHWGAVSEPVAAAMAEGALKHSQANYSISITGIAGPDGGTNDKPVGTVCFAWAEKKTDQDGVSSHTEQKQFSGDRESVRMQSAVFALQNLERLISGENNS